MSNEQSQDERHDPITGEVLENPSTVDAVAAQAQSDAGTNLENIITTKTFLPPDADTNPRNDPRKLIAMEPLGSRMMLGSLAGVIYRIERKEKEWEGTMLSSVRLYGRFEAKVYASGLVQKASEAVLPRSYGNLIESAYLAALADGADPRTMKAQLDVEVGVKSAAKPGSAIPFNWTVVNFIEDASDSEIRAIRQRQEARLARREQAQLAAPSNVKAITSKK